MTLQILRHVAHPVERVVHYGDLLQQAGIRSAGETAVVCSECGDLLWRHPRRGGWAHFGFLAKRIDSPMYWGVPF